MINLVAKKIQSHPMLLFESKQDSIELQIEKFHSELKPEEKLRIIDPCSKNPQYYIRLILSTEIAESALTIQNVKYVIDSGFETLKKFDDSNLCDFSELSLITKQSALQRQGRVGRTHPGVCYKMYSREQEILMQKQKVEIENIYELLVLYHYLKGFFEIQDFFEKFQFGMKKILKANNELAQLGVLEERENGFGLTEKGYFCLKITEISVKNLCVLYDLIKLDFVEIGIWIVLALESRRELIPHKVKKYFLFLRKLWKFIKKC